MVTGIKQDHAASGAPATGRRRYMAASIGLSPATIGITGTGTTTVKGTGETGAMRTGKTAVTTNATITNDTRTNDTSATIAARLKVASPSEVSRIAAPA